MHWDMVWNFAGCGWETLWDMAMKCEGYSCGTVWVGTLWDMAMKCEGYGCGTVWVGALWYIAM